MFVWFADSILHIVVRRRAEGHKVHKWLREEDLKGTLLKGRREERKKDRERSGNYHPINKRGGWKGREEEKRLVTW